MNDNTETPVRPRTSRFKEHTNTASSIRAPPDELWKDLGIEDMIDKFNDENAAPAVRKGASRTPTPTGFGGASVAPHTPAASEGTTFGRFSRAVASVFGGFGSVLGKRKASALDAERESQREKQALVLDERKQAADEAYQARKLAQQQGLLPTPKVFVRPTVLRERREPGTPRTPGLYRSPSKKDLTKQKKLSKRVSDLEFKLASARKELHTVLGKELPPVPPLPTLIPPTPTLTPELTPTLTPAPTPTPDTSLDTQEVQQLQVGKIVKKRKATATDDDDTYKPVPTDSDGDVSMSAASEPEQRSVKRAKSNTAKKLKRQSSRQSTRLNSENAVRIVPDGKGVPDVPKIPNGVQGKKIRVGDDGYGGLEHEMF